MKLLRNGHLKKKLSEHIRTPQSYKVFQIECSRNGEQTAKANKENTPQRESIFSEFMVYMKQFFIFIKTSYSS